MTDGPVFGLSLAVALIALLSLAVTASWIGHLNIRKELVIAAVRGLVQLIIVSAVIGVVMAETWSSVLFATGMFTVAVGTAGGRIGARQDWPWIAAALATGVLPVLAIVFVSRTAPFTGPAVIPIAGIVIGGSMTAHTLTARRSFDALRSGKGLVEAGLSLGLTRPSSISIVIDRHSPEALTPVLDQTRTVGLVTLPGAFIGVLLGGGSAAQAAASQVLVLVGLLAAETSVVVATQRLISRGRILPADIRESLPPR